MLPFTIHSDTITSRSSDIVAPSSGSTFGWLRVLHAATSLQNPYETWSVIWGYNEMKTSATHSFDPLRDILWFYSQNLGRDLPAFVLTLPHIRKPTVVHGAFRWVIAKRYH